MNVVLVEPEIPPNTGNIARLCAATRTTLHLVEPLGFQLDNHRLHRAGMDYWQYLKWRRWTDWKSFASAAGPSSRLWFIESGGTKTYADARFQRDDFLVFGRETKGLPRKLLESHPGRWLRIPMFHSDARSLNVSNCVALVLYEALRQLHFPGECRPPQNPLPRASP